MIIYKNFPLSKMSYIKVGGTVAKVYIPEKFSEINELVTNFYKNSKIAVFGYASNILFPDSPRNDLIYVSTKKLRDKFEIHNNTLTVSAGYSIMETINNCAAKGFGGNLIKLSGIPGTLGGAVYMNAGSGNDVNDFLGNYVLNVLGIDLNSGKQFVLKPDEINFSYRDSIFKQNKNYLITELEIQIDKVNRREAHHKIKKNIEQKIKSQPVKLPSLGCAFKNTKGIKTWKLIESVVNEIEKCGTMEISPLHHNFIINNSHCGLESDYIKLIDNIYLAVKNKHNIELEREVEFFNEIYK